MWRTLPLNLWAGLRLSIFRPVERRDFRVTWGALWMTLFIYGVLILGADYLGTKPPREFDWRDGILPLLARWSFYLFAASIVAAWLARGQRVLHLAIVVLNSFFWPWLLFLAAYLWLPRMQGREDIYNDVRVIEYCWAYLAAFRCCSLLFNNQRSFFAAMIMTGAFYLSMVTTSPTFWYHDYANDDDRQKESISVEDTLQNQHILLDKSLAQLKKPVAGQHEIYGLIFGGVSYQDVFMKEARFVEDELAKDMGMAGRLLVMINNKKTIKDVPLATSVNLRTALKALGGKMQTQEDIALLYLTSHGGKTSGVSVSMGYQFGLRDIAPKLLADMFKESGIKNKIVIVSTCYSGTMIEPLQDDNSLIITASAKDRTSFGCSDEADLTYFADAYFKQALPKSKNFLTAFAEAEKLVAEREKKENIEPHSEPQIFIGKNMKALLEAK